MREMIEQNEVPGAVTVFATRDGLSHLGVIGHGDADKTRPLRIASMTKPVTAVAVLMMQDEGKLSIDDPVSKYIPEFGANGVTLRHMLTHTSGMGGGENAGGHGADLCEEALGIRTGKPVAVLPVGDSHVGARGGSRVGHAD